MKSVYGNATQGARDYQEDTFSIDEQDPERPNSDVLITLCDGMGGHAGGEVASGTAAKAFSKAFLRSDETDAKIRLGRALDAANQAVATKIAEDPKLQGMGCTLVGAIKLHNRLVWISVGDSHIYRYRAGTVEKLNKDHSVFGELKEMVHRGEITQQEALSNPKRNALRSAILGKKISLIDINSTPLEEGDLILVASDGLDTLSMEDLRNLLERQYGKAPEDVVHQVLDAVANVQKPNQDNTSLVASYHTAHDAGFWSDTTIWDATPSTQQTKSRAPLIGALAAALIVAVGVLLVVLSRPTPEPEETVAQPANGDVSTEIEEISRDDATDGQDDAGVIQNDPEPDADPAVDANTDDASEQDGAEDAAPAPPDGETVDQDPVDETPAEQEPSPEPDEAEPAGTPDPGDEAGN
ncbi:MAG: protein phosphatase 2C domain-containing protein [Pseudomonadota bacterium]